MSVVWAGKIEGKSVW